MNNHYRFRLHKRLRDKFSNGKFIEIHSGDLNEILNEAERLHNELVNKPVETTNEQPKMEKDLKIQIMNIMTKHIDLRNSDNITNIDLYHDFIDWEKEIYKILLG